MFWGVTPSRVVGAFQRFNPEDVDSVFLRNIGTYLRVFTTSRPRRMTSSVILYRMFQNYTDEIEWGVVVKMFIQTCVWTRFLYSRTSVSVDTFQFVSYSLHRLFELTTPICEHKAHRLSFGCQVYAGCHRMQPGCKAKRSASISTVVSCTKVLRCHQTKKSDGLSTGDRAGHALSPLTLTFCCISFWGVDHKGSVSRHMFT
jgi:hypothetical protein